MYTGTKLHIQIIGKPKWNIICMLYVMYVCPCMTYSCTNNCSYMTQLQKITYLKLNTCIIQCIFYTKVKIIQISVGLYSNSGLKKEYLTVLIDPYSLYTVYGQALLLSLNFLTVIPYYFTVY